MPSQYEANEELLIDDVIYRIAEHPVAPGMPYAQEGKQAVVYQLGAGAEHRALKVFKPRYRLPALVYLGEQLEHYAGLPGLAVCWRTVLTPQRHADVLRQHPDMIYAVLMPWIEGPTWMQVLIEKRPLSPEQSLSLARSFAYVLATMEQRGLAHCDLSAPNVMLPELAGGKGVALVDVEQMYGPELRRPAVLPSGSPGYTHRMAPQGLWAEEADRFAGAVLLAEMLSWCDERVRNAAWGEHYFDPHDLQRDCERFHLLRQVLRAQWGERLANLFERAWRSDVMNECPTLGEWLLQLPQSVPLRAEREAQPQRPPEAERLAKLLAEAEALEARGELERALDTCCQALAVARRGPATPDQIAVIQQAIDRLESQLKAPPPPPVSTEELFKAALEAYQRREWPKAKELLAEVVRREAGYTKDGFAADALLRQVERQLWLLRWRGALAALALLVFAAIVWSAAVMVNQWQEAAKMQATATAIVAPTHTAQAEATRTALLVAASTAQAQHTATAQAQSRMTAAALVTATSKAAAQATETAAAEATQTAVAQATQTAVAQQTGTAAAHATSTAVAMRTATAQAAATSAARPTKTPLAPAPALLAPANGAQLGGDSITLLWQWSRKLEPDEYFDVRVWQDGEESHGIAWTVDTQHILKLRSGKYNWSILVLRHTGTLPNGTKRWVAVSLESEVRWFSYSAPAESPTPTKAPPTPPPEDFPAPYP